MAATRLIPYFALAGCLSCASNPNRPEFEETRIVDRMDGVDETPAFASGAKVMWQEGKEISFANIATMGANTRIDACLKVAAVQARVEILRYIKENITASGQLAEADAESDPAYESLVAFLSQGQLSGAKIKERYYDRREVSEPSGERALKLRCAVRLGIARSVLEKQLRKALNPTAKGNPEIREKLLTAQKDFLDNL